ncbi:MAG: rhodanese-like domain-containing protein [Verrucomicrobiales bacterium]
MDQNNHLSNVDWAEWTMGEVLTHYPGARRAIFRRYHLGGCSSCGFSLDETLGNLCQRNGALDPHEVMEEVTRSAEADREMEISPHELKELLTQDPPPHILDIRTREEWDAVRLPQATFFSNHLMQEMLVGWPKDRLVVIIDHHGQRSLDAVAYFLGQGFQHVKSLQGGIDAWARQIDPDMPRYEIEA